MRTFLIVAIMFISRVIFDSFGLRLATEMPSSLAVMAGIGILMAIIQDLAEIKKNLK